MKSKKYNMTIPGVLFTTLMVLAISFAGFGATKTTTGNGNWNSPSTWTPSGEPTAADDVIILSGHAPNVNVNNGQCRTLTVQSGATLLIGNSRKLSINHSGGLNISGTLDITSGNITVVNNNTTFNILAGGSVNWNPGDNSLAGASLFTKCIENFAPTSTLTMRKWYNTNVGLGNVVSSNFGNLTIHGVGGTWQMQNSLEAHVVVGALTITSSYVVLDNSGSISNTSIGSIHLTNSSAFLDFLNGTHGSSFTVNTGNVSITAGELDCFYGSGSGTCHFNVNGNLSITSGGYLIGSNNHNGSIHLTVNGNVTLTRSNLFGIYDGSGNFTMQVSGNLSTFKVGTTFSELYGIVDGNGSVTMEIEGDLTNQGYFDLIWNSGVTGVGNGNCSLTVQGTMRQSEGDFRGIWNATTTNSGSCTINLDTLNFSGGIFMCTYSCSSTPVSNSLNITGSAGIHFTSAGDIFRGNGMATVSGSQNNATFNLSCNGPMIVSGNTSAELSPNVAYGTETILLGSTLDITGGNTMFGYTDHNITLSVTGNTSISNGTTCFSRSSGTADLNFGNDLDISGGTLVFKSNTGKTSAAINGNFSFSNGTVKLYANSGTASNDSTTLFITGNFSHTGGNLEFSDNTLNTGPVSVYSYGSEFTLGGSGTISSAGSGTSTYFGKIFFCNNSNFSRTSTNHHIQQVKYIVQPSVVLNVLTGPMELSSHNNPGTDFLTVSEGSTIILGVNTISSNVLFAHSGLNVANAGILKTAHPNGLFDGGNEAAISAAGNMDYSLHLNSTVYYYGTDNQKISGFGQGIANGTQHQYGNLTVDFNGTADTEYTYLGQNTPVRATLFPQNGELKLNGYTLTAEALNSSGTGYVKSEEPNAINQSKLKLAYTPSNKNLLFPFGKSSTALIPVNINITNNPGTGYITVSTRATGPDNNPLPGTDYVSAITNINPGGPDVSTTHVIDRWWEVHAPGVTAQYSLRYAGSENSTSGSVSGGSFNVQYWNGSVFTKINSSGTGVTSGTGTVVATLNNISGPLVLSSGSASLPIKLLQFDVKAIGSAVDINWSTAEEKNNDFFSIERSSDGAVFDKIEEIDGAGNSSSILRYRTMDHNPLPGTSYYRLKQTDFDGRYSYSPVRVVNRGTSGTGTGAGSTASIEILTLSPNPFNREFRMDYQISQAGETKISMYNMSGQLVFESSKQDETGRNSFEYSDENSLPTGNYIVQIANGAERITRKIIKTSN
ncbi:MAG: T9SS type A sorting domain-containing protein [Bacteroidia bacterium]|nr:T9SS type A sorting domain-containing protein [Bacteroidia bacterium]